MDKKTNLDILDFSQVFQALASTARTGTLKVNSSSGAKHIYFKDGRVTNLHSSDHKTLLGKALLKTGRITERALKKALKVQGDIGGKLGEVVLVQGLTDKDGIKAALEFQITEEVCDLFTWKGISCEFTPGEPDGIFEQGEDDVGVSLVPESLMMEAARRMDEWELLRSTLSSMKDVYAPLDDVEEPADEAEALVFNLVDGFNDVEEITEKAAMSNFETLKILHQLASQEDIQTITPMEYYESGVECAEEGRFKKCVKFFERAEELGVNEFDLPNRLAEVYVVLKRSEDASRKYLDFAARCRKEKRQDDAVLAFQNSLKHDPHNVDARRSLIEVLIRQRRFEEVTRQTEMLSAEFIDQGKKDEAVAAWKRTVKAQPDNLDAYRKLSDLYCIIGDPTQAIIELDNLAGSYLGQKRPEKAIEIYREMLVLDPECMEARLGLAETLATIGRKEDASEEYHALAKTLSASGVVTSKANYAFLVNIYEKMSALNPADPEVRETLATIYLDGDETDKAINHYKDIAHIILEGKNPGDSIKYLRKVVEIEPDDISVRLDLAEALLMSQNRDGAIASLHELADHLLGHGKETETARIYRKILEIAPFDLKSMRGLTTLHGTAGRREEKYRMCRRICACCRGADLAKEGIKASVEANGINKNDTENLLDLIYFSNELGDKGDVIKYSERLARIHLDENNLGLAAGLANRMLAIDGAHAGANIILEEVGGKNAQIEGAKTEPKTSRPADKAELKIEAPETPSGPVIESVSRSRKKGGRKRKKTGVLTSMEKLKALKGRGSAGEKTKAAPEPKPEKAPADSKGNDGLPAKIDGTKKVKGAALGGAASRLAALRKKKKE